MPPRDRNPFENTGFRDSVDGYYDGDVQVGVLSSLRDDATCVFLTVALSLCGGANSGLLNADPSLLQPTSNTGIPLGATSPRYSPFPAESTDSLGPRYGMASNRYDNYTANPLPKSSSRKKWTVRVLHFFLPFNKKLNSMFSR